MTALHVIPATKRSTVTGCLLLDPPSRPVPPDTPLPSLMRRLKCSRCRSKRVDIKPQPYSGEGGQLSIKLLKYIKTASYSLSSRHEHRRFLEPECVCDWLTQAIRVEQEPKLQN